MQFSKLVNSIIRPLLSTMGFVNRALSEDIIEFEQRDIIIIVSYDSQVSDEVDFMFNFKYVNCSYSLSELMKATKYATDFEFATQITDELAMINWLEKVRHFLSEYMPSVLTDPASLSKTLDANRTKEIENDKNARFEVRINEYWIKKDYMGIVKLVESYDGKLNKIAKRKYEYSMKMI